MSKIKKYSPAHQDPNEGLDMVEDEDGGFVTLSDCEAA